jgi:hypothetical protein
VGAIQEAGAQPGEPGEISLDFEQIAEIEY